MHWYVRGLSCKPNIYVSWSTSELRVRLARHETSLSPPVKYFTERCKAVLLLWIFYVFFCLVVIMPLCASVYMCLVVTCYERADLLALVCGVWLWVCHFPIGILGQVRYFIVSIPDLCTLTFLYAIKNSNPIALVGQTVPVLKCLKLYLMSLFRFLFYF